MKKRKLAFLLVLLLTAAAPMQSIRATGNPSTTVYTVYENFFDNGCADAMPVENSYLRFDGILGQPLINAQKEGNMGVRINSGAWLFDRTFLFDFTAAGSRKGVYSGRWCISFDFSMDAESTADSCILGMNMTKAYAGQRMFYFYDNGRIGATEYCGAWGHKEHPKNTAVEYGKIYHLESVIDFDKEKAEFYLDGRLIGVQDNLKGCTMENYAISLSGLIEYFDNLRITVEYPYWVENVVTGEELGNIFFEDTPVELRLRTINRHSEAVQQQVTAEITDMDGKVSWRKDWYLELPGESDLETVFSPTLPKFGVYTLKVTSENAREFTMKLSRCVRAEEKNQKLGVCGHFDGRMTMNIPGVLDLISSAGFGALRTDWGCRRDPDGSVYDYDSDGGYFEETIRTAREKGIDILAILDIGVSGKGIDGGFNTDANALEAYRKYCAELAGMLRGKVERFELGNENNYTKRWAAQADIGVNRVVLSNGRTLVDADSVYVYTDGQYNRPVKYPLNLVSCRIEEKKKDDGNRRNVLQVIEKETGKELLRDIEAYVFETGAEYYQILRAGSEGIRMGNPNAEVATSGCQVVYRDPDGTANRNNREFAEGMLNAAQQNRNYCFDAYAVHPYHTVQPPESKDFWIMNTGWHEQGEILEELFRKYAVPQEKKRWATEFGYSSAGLNAEETEQRAAWLIRTLLANEIYGCYDTMYLYDILNDGLDTSNSEHNFGTLCFSKDESWYHVSAYAAKPQYLAIAQYNKMLADARYIRNVVTDGSVYMTEFRRKESTVFAVWNTKGTDFSIDVMGSGKNVTVYDMYGNVMESCLNQGGITVHTGEKPVYVEFFNPKTEIKFVGDMAEVTLVNNTARTISPVILVTAADERGVLRQFSSHTTYRVAGNEVSALEPGQTARASVGVDFGDSCVRVMVWENTDLLRPMCVSRRKPQTQ